MLDSSGVGDDGVAAGDEGRDLPVSSAPLPCD